jgi:hypothetical protein
MSGVRGETATCGDRSKNDPIRDIWRQTGQRDFAHRKIVKRFVASAPVEL